jgi:phosphonate transport system substrate-binding protein
MYLNNRPVSPPKKLLLVIYCGLLLCLPWASSADELSSSDQAVCKNTRPIIFGVLPFISGEQLVTRFSPIARYLSRELHTTVRIETAPNFAEFARRTLDEKRYDILFTAPHFYPPAHSKAGYRLIAGVDSPGMWALIVAPRQSKIYKLDDLRGKRLATVSATSLATLLVRKHLSDAGIDPDTELTMINTPSHDASLLSSYHGVTDASALMQPPFSAASPRVKESMRIIARTDSTPHIPISVSPRISESCGREISKILLEMKNTERGKRALSHSSFSGFKKTSAEDYEIMKQLLSR